MLVIILTEFLITFYGATTCVSSEDHSSTEENFDLHLRISSPYDLGSIGSAYHRRRTWMDSAGRLCADGIGGLLPQNGHLSNLIGASPAWTISPTRHPDNCRLYELGSVGSAYHGLPILINSSGHICADVIGGPYPNNGCPYPSRRLCNPLRFPVFLVGDVWRASY